MARQCGSCLLRLQYNQHENIPAMGSGLKNILWIKRCIDDVKYLDIGLFNDILCSGVLHHLKNPDYGFDQPEEIFSSI